MKSTRTSGQTSLAAAIGGALGRGLGLGAKGGVRARRAARLAALSGRGEEAHRLEQLEQRQLLAFYAIDPSTVDPQTGLGSREINFDYYLHSFRRIEATQAANPTVIDEIFDDENAGWTTANPPAPPNGTFFNTSNIQIAYSSQQSAPVQLIRRPIGAQQTDAALYLNLQANDQASFTFFAPNNAGGTPQSRQVVNAAFQVSGDRRPGGLGPFSPFFNTDAVTGTRLELLRNGQVVATFRGTALQNLAQPAFAPTGAPALNFVINFDGGFDTLRFRSASDGPIDPAYADEFVIERIQATLPGGQFSQQLEALRFQARARLVGPAGAEFEIVDLYGRDLVLGNAAPVTGNEPTPGDPTDIGRVQFNDGIGRITIRGTNARSSFSIIGATTDSERALSLFNDFESAGFGYAFSNEPTPRVIGLPPGQGTIVVGSPYIRDNSTPANYRNPNGFNLGPDDFNRAGQGVFIDDGSTIGSILIDGVLHGSSVITGAVERFSVGLMVGSLRVDGDLGVFSSASDAGMWFRDDQTGAGGGFAGTPTISTGSRLNVGRTLREVAVAGRNGLNISVLADVNNPQRARLGLVDFFSRESIVVGGGDDEAPTVLANFNAGTSFNGRGNGIQGQAVPYAGGFFRNDDLSGAEFVGYNGTRTRVFGTINGTDAINEAPDQTDVYAFPADPSREVVISAISSEGAFGGFTDVLGIGRGYYRVVDRDGRVVAAIDAGRAGRGPGGNSAASSIIRFRPDRADVYYLVLNVRPQGGGPGFAYGFSINGMAPVTLGAVRSDSGLGGNNSPLSVAVSAGSMGLVSIGTGSINSAGDLVLGSTINTNLGGAELARWGRSTVSVAGSLFAAVGGFDVDGANLVVGDNLGSFSTGAIGRSVLNGDLFTGTIRVGGTISTLDIRGALGADQIADNEDRLTGSVSIISGSNPNRRGDIGEISVGAYMVGGALSLSTGSNSQVDKFIIGSNADGAGTEYPGQIIGGTPGFTTGLGADVRFVDFRSLSRPGDPNARQIVNFGQSITLVDDAGATVTISFTGGATNPPGTAPGTPQPTAGTQAVIRTVPINGSRGVAIASIDVTLRGGASLVINGTAPGVVSIGRITVDSAFGATGVPGPLPQQARSSVLISGVSEIDVYEIRQTVGDLAEISNTTAGGDIVAIDALVLDRITIGGGNLGRTQVSSAGARLIGPFRDLISNSSAVGGPLLVRPEAINQADANNFGNDWDDSKPFFLPVNPTDDTFWDGSRQTLEDVGSPIDGYLNGVVVRTGDLLGVTVSGSVGDVLVETGHLIALTANSDNLTPQGDFQGVEGSVYAIAMGTLDIGDGLRGAGVGPFATAGIFSDTGIVSVVGTRSAFTLVQGTIAAAAVGEPLTQLGTVTPVDLPAPLDGIGEVRIGAGRYDGALILGQNLDDFWGSVRVRDRDVRGANVGNVASSGADLFRSEVGGLNIGNVTLTGGDFDASIIDAAENIGVVTATTFRNSTRLGTPAEFSPGRISATRDLDSIIATGPQGDVSDLTVDLSGSLTGRISARNVDRMNLLVDNVVNSVEASGDFRGNTVVSGRVNSIAVAGNIRASSFRIAGPVVSVTAGGEITQLELVSTGPDGRVDLLRAQGLLQGSVSSSGDIGTIESVTSNVAGRIETRNDVIRPRNGGIGTLRAGNDLLVDLSVLGGAGTVFAQRNIGTFGAVNPPLDIRGDLGNLTAASGQTYADVLVGQNITGTVSNGRVNMRPGADRVSTAGILAFGRINAIVSSGDWAGPIVSRSGGIGSITINNGSLRPGATVTVNNGSLDALTINAGDLLASVRVDGSIGAITLNSLGGWRAQIGVSDFKRDFTRFQSDIRNQLPSGVQRTAGLDGVVIRAGGDIGSVTVNGGSIWESVIFAGGTIGSVNANAFRNDTLTPGLNNAIAATVRVGSVTLRDFVGGLAVLGGVTSLGADERPGGTGADADQVGAGVVGPVVFSGPRVTNSVVFAGVAPSVGGAYNTTESRVTSGRSRIESVTATGVINNTAVFSDGALGPVTPGLTVGNFRAVTALEPSLLAGGNASPQAGETALVNGTALLVTTTSGEQARVTLSGPGRGFWNPSLNRVRLINTNAGTSLTVVSAGSSNSLTDFKILGARNLALGTLSVAPRLLGDSTVFVDNTLGSASFGVVNTTGVIGAGGDVGTLSATRVNAGTVRGRFVSAFNVAQDFAGRAAFLQVDSVSVSGNLGGAVWSQRDIAGVSAGTINGGGVSSGGSIGSVVASSTLNARIAARGALGSVSIAGNATGSSLLGGVDLGADADFGGTGADADTVGAGSVNSVFVGGNFERSDVAAGVSRGPSGYIGNEDVAVSAGRSSIGTVTIGGTLTGSSLGSEQYRVISTGTIGSVTVGGVAFTGAGNFRVERRQAAAIPVRIVDLSVGEDARIYSARIAFNQDVDFSTVGPALSVIELRDGGAQIIGLAEGTDYTLSYDKATFTVSVVFSRAVTERNLPRQPGLPGPGVYQLVLSAAVLRGSTQDSRLDGNTDGASGDDWSRNVVIGDAGDKINSGNPASAPQIDFYGATDLNLVLRTAPGVGSVPETNTRFTINGVVGDHPDTDPDVFRLGGDADVYRVSLRAGQIIRLGEMTGVALGAARGLFDASGNEVGPGSALASTLPANESIQPDATPEQQLLIRVTGTYYIVVAGSLQGVNIADVNSVNNADVTPGAFGRYAFDVEIRDDQDTGFTGDTNSGTGAAIAYAPTPSVFAGPDGVFGTGDDVNTFTTGDWTFRLIRGSTSPGGPDAVVTGTNSKGYLSERRSAPNGTFGSAGDRLTVTISSSIGLPAATGNPTQISPDVDVFRLNNGQPIAAGTKLRVKLRLTELGSNIGLAPETAVPGVRELFTLSADLFNQALLGLFETPAGTGFDNARLVFAPSDFLPVGNQPASTITDGRNAYGYDTDGNFFFDIVIPGALGTSSAPASYALVLQGAIRSDYTLEITQQGTGSLTTNPQNVLLELQGGTINWLEAGEGVTTALAPFATSVVGFSGQIDGLSVDTYVINTLLANLNAVFAAANANVTIATTPAAFQRQSFSTVFLAGNVEPNAFFANGQFGASQRVDLLNADRNDQAVVFLSSLSELGFDASRQGVDLYIQALTAAVGRRIGELLGVRIETTGAGGGTLPIMAANSPLLAGQGLFRFANTPRNLAGTADNIDNTAFYFGSQNSGQLINRIVAPRV